MHFYVRIPQNAEENLTVNMVMSKETKFILAKELPIQIWVILACNVIHCHKSGTRTASLACHHFLHFVLVSLRLCGPMRTVLLGTCPSLLQRGLLVS